MIENAGGVNSPGTNTSLQVDLYRPLRLPAILVGDGRLGGISSTLSSLDSLQLRGGDDLLKAFHCSVLFNVEYSLPPSLQIYLIFTSVFFDVVSIRIRCRMCPYNR